MNTFSPKNLADWHEWLIKHNQQEAEIWLVFCKTGSGKTGISYEEAVEEAICFGWVDSLIKNLDAESHIRKFTPRRSGSPWSELNIARATRMIEAGRMTEAGQKLFRESAIFRAPDSQTRKTQQENWRTELLGLLSPEIKKIYQSLSPSLQRQYAGWVMSAKKPETRQNRIEELSATLSRGELLGLK